VHFKRTAAAPRERGGQRSTRSRATCSRPRLLAREPPQEGGRGGAQWGEGPTPVSCREGVLLHWHPPQAALGSGAFQQQRGKTGRGKTGRGETGRGKTGRGNRRGNREVKQGGVKQGGVNREG